MSKINSLLIHYLLLLSLTLINSQSIQEVYYGPAAIRSMTMLSDGTMLGGRVAGHEIQVWVNTNKGLTWSLRGSVANNNDIDFGDVMFKAIPNTNVVFCAFREHNRSNGLWSVTVCRSDDNGFNWVYDSTVIGGQSPVSLWPVIMVHMEVSGLQCKVKMVLMENGLNMVL